MEPIYDSIPRKILQCTYEDFLWAKEGYESVIESLDNSERGDAADVFGFIDKVDIRSAPC